MRPPFTQDTVARLLGILVYSDMQVRLCQRISGGKFLVSSSFCRAKLAVDVSVGSRRRHDRSRPARYPRDDFRDDAGPCLSIRALAGVLSRCG